LIATPHASIPTAPHLPTHAFGWQVCDVGSFSDGMQTCPLPHGDPQTKTLPEHGSVYLPQVTPGGHAVTGVHPSGAAKLGAPSWGS
jgi:hypothetical protein